MSLAGRTVSQPMVYFEQPTSAHEATRQWVSLGRLICQWTVN
jgi:hypothetical protein